MPQVQDQLLNLLTCSPTCYSVLRLPLRVCTDLRTRAVPLLADQHVDLLAFGQVVLGVRVRSHRRFRVAYPGTSAGCQGCDGVHGGLGYLPYLYSGVRGILQYRDVLVGHLVRRVALVLCRSMPPRIRAGFERETWNKRNELNEWCSRS